MKNSYCIEVKVFFELAEIYFCKIHSSYNSHKHLHTGQSLPGVSLFSHLKYLKHSIFTFVIPNFEVLTCNVLSSWSFAAVSIKRTSSLEVFCKKCVLRNFAEFTGKHLCQSLSFSLFSLLASAYNFIIQTDSGAGVFL